MMRMGLRVCAGGMGAPAVMILPTYGSGRGERVPGHVKMEVAAAPHLARTGDKAPVGDHDFPGDREPQTGASRLLPRQAVELLEYLAQALGRDARPLIPDAAPHESRVRRL